MEQQATGMERYIAFLRAINVGGHTVKMEQLRALFADLDLAQVETFIASGNVIFTAPRERAPLLEAQVAAHLQQALGYAVATFIRTTGEVADVANYQPFSTSSLTGADTSLYVAFLPTPLSPSAQQALQAACSANDEFHSKGREVYWLSHTRMSDSPFSGPRLEKLLGLPATVRNVTTVRKLAAKYAAPPIILT